MGSMALQLKPFTVPDPLETYGRAMSLRALMDERRYRQLREQQAQQKILEDQEERQQAMNLRQLFSTNPNPTMQQIMSVAPGSVGIRAATEIRQAQAAEEQQKTAALTREKTQNELDKFKRQLAVNKAAAILREPDPERRAAAWARHTPELVDLGMVPPDELARGYDDNTFTRLFIETEGQEAYEKLLEARKEAERKEAAEKRAAEEHAAKMGRAPLETRKLTAETERAEQEAAGTIPETEHQRLTREAQAAPSSPDEVIAWMEQPGRTPEDIERGKRMLAGMTRYRQAVRPTLVTATPGLVEAVIQNPNLWDSLTPTARTEIAPEIARRGGGAIFGKPLSEAAIGKISKSKAAIASLRDLRGVLTANEKYIGPISGLQALYPYSEARKAQADIDRVRQRVGKTLEEGVLRKEDEEKYKKILATLTDVPSTAIYKVDQLLEDLTRDMDIFLDEQKSAGRRVGPSAPTTPGAGGVTVKAPNGKTYRFPTQAEADAFKKRAGIQ